MPVLAPGSQVLASGSPVLPVLPVCAATVRLCRAAVSGWSPARHWLHHGGFRAARTLLHVHERVQRLVGAGEQGCLPYLPVELSLLMCAHLRRDDFLCGALIALGESMQPRPWLFGLWAPALPPPPPTPTSLPHASLSPTKINHLFSDNTSEGLL